MVGRLSRGRLNGTCEAIREVQNGCTPMTSHLVPMIFTKSGCSILRSKIVQGSLPDWIIFIILPYEVGSL